MAVSQTIIDRLIDLTGGRASGVPEVLGVSQEGPTWIDSELSDVERSNVEVVRRFWEVWKAIPFDPDTLRDFLREDAVVRIGWRGDHVYNGREDALAAFVSEVQRQVDYDERADFKLPAMIAAGPIVFHTWTWISSSERLGYRFERPMAALFLLREGKIERWDSYATGKESAVDYVQGTGPDGL